jgi:hypothetical protein
LVVLCSKCHDKVDRNEIIVNGWKETSKGRVFDYEIQEHKKQSKYSEELIKYIKKQKKYNNAKMTRIKIKEKFSRKVSTKSIINIWNDIY